MRAPSPRKVRADTEALRQWIEQDRAQRGIATVALTREDIEAIAEAVFQKLRRCNTERHRRRRLPCGRGSSVPVCWGSAVYGPERCTCG